MSLSAVTPAGGLVDQQPPALTPIDGTRFSFRYVAEESEHAYVFALPIPKRPPLALQLDITVELEEGMIVLSAEALDVSVEGSENPAEVFRNLVDAVQEWLEYLRDEQPRLAPALAGQERYVELLDYQPGTWFRRLHVA